jgi:hypothetical protein
MDIVDHGRGGVQLRLEHTGKNFAHLRCPRPILTAVIASAAPSVYSYAIVAP